MSEEIRSPDSPLPESVDLTQPSPEQVRMRRWERALLDLTLRNPLLHYRAYKASAPVCVLDAGALESALAQGREFDLLPAPDDPAEGVTPEHWDGLLRQRRLRTGIPAVDLEARLTAIYRSARTRLEESGSSALFLALGQLVWFTADDPSTPHPAPLLLLPVELVRRPGRRGYRLRASDDEPLFNITLLELLRQEFDIDIRDLDPLPEDEAGLDVNAVFERVRQAVSDRSGWVLQPDAVIGFFAFAKHILWRDLRYRAESLNRSPVVRSLAQGRLCDELAALPIDESRLDDLYPPDALLCPLSADSSQLAAVAAADAGQSFGLHGPPGTGKSQTIANIIAHMLGRGRSVLFVAEKMAALTVVQRRLQQLGLDTWCLPVHSHKTRKQDVLAHLRRSLDAAAPYRQTDWQREAAEMARLRRQLNDYTDALHQQRAIGHSLYRGLSELASGKSGAEPVRYAPETIAALDADRLTRSREALRQLAAAARLVAPPSEHPWAQAELSVFTPELRHQIVSAITGLRQAAGDLTDWMSRHAELLGLTGLPTVTEAPLWYSLIRRLAEAQPVTEKLLTEPDWMTLRQMVTEWVQHGRQRDALRTVMLQRYTEAVIHVDISALRRLWRDACDQWWLPREWARMRVERALRRVTRGRRDQTETALSEELDQLSAFHAEEWAIIRATPSAELLLGALWRNGEPDWQEVESALEWADAMRDLANRFAGRSSVSPAELLQHWAARLTPPVRDRSLNELPAAARRVVALQSAESGLIELLNWRGPLLPETSSSDGWPEALFDRLAAMETHLDVLREWAQWMYARGQARALGLTPAAEAFERNTLTADELYDAAMHGLYRCWVEQIISHDPALRHVSRQSLEETIALFQELDDRLLELTRRELRARLAGQAPIMHDPSALSEMGILRRELQKQRNHLPLRRLFAQIPHLLPRLTPCLLMSPISVAQYLSPEHPPFDLVIFDEASQVTTADAIGAIARGSQVIIVGDPKQLPPTRFFMAGTTEDEPSDESVPEDLESILDDCLAVGLPERRLRWHYRSRHESLIAFSNRRYYDGMLYTFPTPDSQTSQVRLEMVDGVYDRGGTRQNRREAEAVVREVERLLHGPSPRSVGVVTLNSAQQQLLEDLLDDLVRRNPHMERWFNGDLPEPVFVKNLENVQGDERDVIVLSVGYGPDREGKVTAHFGPINQEGGWRRLNVAITRARTELVVFSSLRPEQIDTTRTAAQGVSDLRQFLDYARWGAGPMPSRSEPDEPMEERLFDTHVCRMLEQRGYTVHPYVGCSGYRMALAVVHPQAPDRYLLGIESDGPMFRDAATARDRCKLRQMVLADLGWTLHRLWSSEWWRSPDAELERIVQSIAHALTAQVRTPPREPFPEPARLADTQNESLEADVRGEKPPPASGPIANIYTPCSLPRVRMRPEAIIEPGALPLLVRQVQAVVAAEAPVSHALLCRRILQAWHVARLGARISTQIDLAVSRAGIHTTLSAGERFYWGAPDAPAKYRGWRAAGREAITQRAIADIADEELINAMQQVLREQVGLPAPELIRETARMMGFSRTGVQVETRMQAVLQQLLQAGRIREGANGCVTLAG